MISNFYNDFQVYHFKLTIPVSHTDFIKGIFKNLFRVNQKERTLKTTILDKIIETNSSFM